MAGWGLDNGQLGGSGVLPAYSFRPTLRARVIAAWRAFVMPAR